MVTRACADEHFYLLLRNTHVNSCRAKVLQGSEAVGVARSQKPFRIALRPAGQMSQAPDDTPTITALLQPRQCSAAVGIWRAHDYAETPRFLKLRPQLNTAILPA